MQYSPYFYTIAARTMRRHAGIGIDLLLPLEKAGIRQMQRADNV